ncbi:MAG: hypothetical protein HQ490_09045 [Lutibacter sp.]|jgi:hypothetical protein|nr:hypothetical protein [Lutibacter sp.]
MDRIKNVFDKIGSLIPGYKGYAERDGRRNCDKILRDSISAQLSESEKNIYSQMKEALKIKDKSKMNELEEVRKETNTFLSKVKFAPYGATGFFSDNQIKEDELFSIYQYDFDLAESVKRFFELSTSDDLVATKNQLKNCTEILLKRNNYINEFK